MATWRTVSTRRVWAFDVEARPGPWGGGDFTFKAMISIAGGYEGGSVDYLGPGYEPGELEDFIQPLRDNTLVITHNGPRYDLPLLNGTLIKQGLAPLPRLLVQDTYAHLPKRGTAFSASLGNLAHRFGVEEQKGHLDEPDWDAVYAGDPAALTRLKLYNCQDVRTTLALRRKLLELGLLGPPTMWRP